MRLSYRPTIAKALSALGVLVVVVAVGLLVRTNAATATPMSTSGGDIQFVNMLTEDASSLWSSTSWQQVASATFVYAEDTAFVRARFSAESYCSGTAGWCSVRILIGGIEGKPAAGTDFAFDSPGTNDYEAHSIERMIAIPHPGHVATIAIQAAVVSGATSLRLDDWMLSMEAID